MWWLGGCLVLFCVFCTLACCRMASEEDQRMEIIEERIIETPSNSTPVPSECWTRYDVPLDDDVQKYICEQCRQYGVPVSVVLAVIERESDFDPELVGDNGNSWGLMQIYNKQHIRRCVDLGAWNLLDPKQNVRVGINYLSELLACGHGMEWALSWYNGHGGEPCQYATDVLKRAEEICKTAEVVC